MGIKKIITPIYYWFVKCIAKRIYEPKYLRGRYFDNNQIGWIWVMKDLPFRLFTRINAGVPWPVSHTVMVNNWKNIAFDTDDIHIFQTGGSYFQAQDAEIRIGRGTWIGPNVGLITTNHDVFDPARHVTGKDISIGEKCWIGMNVVVLPGTELGPHTVVAAGAVVTKSFPEGWCVLAGVPAKPIRYLRNGCMAGLTD